jgi:methyl-accepting chemotaxis protein
METLIEASRRVESTTEELGLGLLELKSSAETGESESKGAAQKARHLHSRAGDNTGSVRELEENADLGRDKISRAIETVLAIGADIDRAAHIFEELNGLSRQIGTSAITIAKIARHTHVLALNAAIEAARAEEHGDEFAVVADQVRTLAGEAGRSARDVRDLVSEVNAGIAAASVAMTASEEKINEVSQIAGGARVALTQIRAASASTADFVTATTESAQSQADSARAFASIMSQLASSSARWHSEIQNAANDVSEQASLMSDLHHTSGRLADIAERLTREASGLSVTQPSDTQDH